ncbi:MAG: DUF503 domain-containing protein [Gemmatimonadota bacterium]
MVVGVLVWELEVVGARSLKDKRRVVKSLTERMRNRFNAGVAETAHQDVWQRAQLSACVVSNDRGHADSMLDAIDRFVANDGRARILDTRRTLY